MRSRQGFSLIELLVALALTGILMAGLAQVFKGTVHRFYQTGDVMGAQRRNRWVFAQIEDDLRMIGYTEGMDVMPPSMPVPPFQIIPQVGPTQNSSRDELSFYSSSVMEECVLDADFPAASTTMRLRAAGTRLPNVQNGDFFQIQDGVNTEIGYFAGPIDRATGVAPIMVDGASQRLQGCVLGLMDPGPERLRGHRQGLRVVISRPAQMVRFTIEDIATDPNNLQALVPCLVRQQQPISSPFVWGNNFQVISENVISFRVDMSVNGGQTWTRGASASWNEMSNNANAALAGTQLRVDNGQLWFKNIPILLRFDVTTRTAMAREENSNAAGTTAFGERSQTLLVMPRNCGLPSQ